jgi:small subunit ribosomal protein S7
MRDGKKFLSYRIIYSVLYRIQEKIKRKPLAIIEHSIRIVTPRVCLKSRRWGGASYQVPVEITALRAINMAICWLLSSARKRHRRSGITVCLSEEILEAALGNGEAIRKREETHRRANSNKTSLKGVKTYATISY